MLELRQSTAVEVRVGPAVAVGDGFTPVTTLTIASADEAELIKHNATTSSGLAGTLAAYTAVVDGYYHLDLSTGETDTLGQLTLVIQDDSLILPLRADFMVINQNFFDSKYGSDLLQVDQRQIVGTTVPTPTTAGIPDVNVERWLDAVVFGVSAGIPDVNVTRINSGLNSPNVLGNWMNEGIIETADSGSTTTLVDAALTQADDFWNGALLVFTGGANNSYSAIVTDFDAASNTITFTPAVPTGVTTEAYVLIPGLGWSDVQAWGSGAVPAPTTTGVPDVNVERIADTIASITGGDLDVNVATLDAAALTAIEDEIWDALKSAHAVANSFGDFLDIETSSRLASADITLASGLVDITQAAADKVFGTSGAALTELSVAIPSATPRPDQAAMLLYMAMRNQLDVTAAIKRIHNDAGTIVATKALTDDGSTYSEAEMISG